MGFVLTTVLIENNDLLHLCFSQFSSVVFYLCSSSQIDYIGDRDLTPQVVSKHETPEPSFNPAQSVGRVRA
jgi:hypothetical protein